MTKTEDLLIKELSKQGFKITVDSDNEVHIEPSVLRLKSITVKTIRRGMYKTDPALVPIELTEDNIFWIDDPVEIMAHTESGEEIPVFALEGITINHEVIHPEVSK